MSAGWGVESVRTAASSAFSRLENAAALAVQSGLVWTFGAKGALTAGRLLAKGKSGPSAIYRIHGANTPDKPALIYDPKNGQGVRHSYGELDTLCDRVAAGLRKRGLAGQSVLVMMKNR